MTRQISILNATPAMADVISGRVPKPSPDLPIKKTCAYLKLREMLNLPTDYSIIFRRRQKPAINHPDPLPLRLREALGDMDARVIKFSHGQQITMAAIQDDGTRTAYIQIDR